VFLPNNHSKKAVKKVGKNTNLRQVTEFRPDRFLKPVRYRNPNVSRIKTNLNVKIILMVFNLNGYFHSLKKLAI
jgi:hypothetical protein